MNKKTRLAVDFEIKLEISSQVRHALHQIAEEQDVDLRLLSAHGYSGETRCPCGGVVTGFIVYGNTTLLILQDLPIDWIEQTIAEITAQENEGCYSVVEKTSIKLDDANQPDIQPENTTVDPRLAGRKLAEAYRLEFQTSSGRKAKGLDLKIRASRQEDLISSRVTHIGATLKEAVGLLRD